MAAGLWYVHQHSGKEVERVVGPSAQSPYPSCGDRRPAVSHSSRGLCNDSVSETVCGRLRVLRRAGLQKVRSIRIADLPRPPPPAVGAVMVLALLVLLVPIFFPF